jgi:pimeloyl-ACP methyl ester carboxylesterase
MRWRVREWRPDVKNSFAFAMLLSLAAANIAFAAERDESNALDVYLKPQTLARLPDGRKLNLFCTGSGSPTAILDAGLLDWSISWRAVQPKMSQSTRVCAVDRAGHGFSDPGPEPRDAAAAVKDLHDALHAAKIKPPYIMVGHSYGGMTTQLFVLKYSSEVAGMLLVDPGFAYFAQKEGIPEAEYPNRFMQYAAMCSGLAKQGKLHAGMEEKEEGAMCVNPGGPDWSKKMSAKLVEQSTKASYYDSLASELRGTEDSTSRDLEAANHPLGAMPITVLTEDIDVYHKLEAPFPDYEKRFAAWTAGHDAIAKLSTRGETMTVEGAGHYIQRDKPDVVAAKFKQLVEAARKP